MNDLLSQKWCLCLYVQNRIKLCRAKNHKFGDEMTVHTHYTHIHTYKHMQTHTQTHTTHTDIADTVMLTNHDM